MCHTRKIKSCVHNMFLTASIYLRKIIKSHIYIFKCLKCHRVLCHGPSIAFCQKNSKHCLLKYVKAFGIFCIFHHIVTLFFLNNFNCQFVTRNDFSINRASTPSCLGLPLRFTFFIACAQDFQRTLRKDYKFANL